MTTLYVNYCTRIKIPCTGQVDPEIILCLEDGALMASGNPFAEATICQWYNNGDCAVPTIWTYTFSYDSELLADDTVPLQTADITGVFCQDCLFNYFQNEIENIGGGGACVVEVTTAELNALVAAEGLTPGCLYTITDFVQGNIVAGATVTLQALTTSQLSSACSVLTTYDTKAWNGIYDLDTNKLIQLEDNQGNVCEQTPESFGLGIHTCIEDFDWGNSRITNCYVYNSIWTLDYGVNALIDAVRIIGLGSALNMSGWTGGRLSAVTIEGGYQVALVGTTALDRVSFSKNTDAIGVAYAQILGVGSISDMLIKAVTIVDAGLIVGADIDSLLLESTSIENSAVLNLSGTGAVTIMRSEFTLGATVNVAAGSDLDRVQVSMGTLNTAGFDLSGVYINGGVTATCGANNTGTAKDYFNDTII